jgi:hypothetical protein
MPFAIMVVRRGGAEHFAVLNFLRDANIDAEQEWRAIEVQRPYEMDRIYDHIQLVEACQSPSSAPLGQALPISNSAGMFWWGVAGVGVFYLYDGRDLNIVLVGIVRDPPPPSWADLASDALARV